MEHLLLFEGHPAHGTEQLAALRDVSLHQLRALQQGLPLGFAEPRIFRQLRERPDDR